MTPASPRRSGLGRAFLIGLPYLWLLLFFLVPFAIVLKLSLSEVAMAQPPYLPLAELLAGYLVDRYRVRHALAWNFVLLAVGSALLPVLDGSGVIWLFIAFNGLGWGAQQVLTPMAIASGTTSMVLSISFGWVIAVCAVLAAWLALVALVTAVRTLRRSQS